jgi:hypothetical protein
MPSDRATAMASADRGRLIDDHQDAAVGGQPGEHLPQCGLVIGERLVVQLAPGWVQRAGVVLALADVQPAEHGVAADCGFVGFRQRRSPGSLRQATGMPAPAVTLRADLHEQGQVSISGHWHPPTR